MSRLFSLIRTVIAVIVMLASSVALAEVAEAASIRLAWSDNSNNESGFKIERKNATGNFAQVAAVGANITSYTDSGLTSGQTYCYLVRAFNSAGSSNPTNTACVTTASTTTATTDTTSNSSTTTSSSTTGGSTSTAGGSVAVFQLSDNRVFVYQQYADFLDREPDPEGFSAWVNALDSGLPRASLIEAFMDSGEFLNKGKFIAQVYMGILARDADHAGFRAWLGALLAGVSREQIVQSFLGSGEFQANFGTILTKGQFVERMYRNILLRPPDVAGLSYWVEQLNSGKMTRAQVALALLDSAEFQNLNPSQNRVDVSLLYFDMLRRDPDSGGFSAWVEALDSGLPLTSAIDGFLASGEYQSQF